MTAAPAFLSRLCAADRAALAERWAAYSYRRDELIIAHGDSGRDVFFVLEGRARAPCFPPTGREVAYRDIEPGDIFGEIAAIDGRRAIGERDRDRVEPARRGLPAAAFRRSWIASPNLPGRCWNICRRSSANDGPGLRVQHAGRARAAGPRAAPPGGGPRADGRDRFLEPGADAFRAGGVGSARTARRCRAR